ncbi:MAG: hypothetical protein BWY41_00143 [Candidatus Atribacteria bacterium ADurb.Bin276]|uniref:Lipoprotein n=1 Tax=Candidatus Atribacter allofermentans TaxID=1852833 RepID=A0A1V5T4L6_9BACT|nr:MAG: hypothetical protein BWY41_00143 [Candidatus Atribacteria bacterium ADurb.Bin276]
MKKLLIAGLLSLALAACGGSSIDIPNNQNNNNNPPVNSGKSNDPSDQSPPQKDEDFSNLFDKFLNADREILKNYLTDMWGWGIPVEEIPVTQELMAGNWIVRVIQRDNLCDIKKTPIYHEYYKNISIAPDGTSFDYEFYPLFNYKKESFYDSKLEDELKGLFGPDYIFAYAHNIPDSTEFYYNDLQSYENIEGKINKPSTLANFSLKYLAYFIPDDPGFGDHYRLHIVASGMHYKIQHSSKFLPETTEEEKKLQQEELQQNYDKFVEEGKFDPLASEFYYISQKLSSHYLINKEFYILSVSTGHDPCNNGVSWENQFNENYYFMKKL